jgi:hypothetical protein
LNCWNFIRAGGAVMFVRQKKTRHPFEWRGLAGYMPGGLAILAEKSKKKAT